MMFYSIIMMKGAVMTGVGWSSLLTSLLPDTREVKGNFKCFNNPVKKGCFKGRDNTECLVVSSHVLTLKYKVKQQLISRKRLFVCVLKKLKEPFLG